MFSAVEVVGKYLATRPQMKQFAIALLWCLVYSVSAIRESVGVLLHNYVEKILRGLME